MCGTSYRHSNCLDQFCKFFSEHSSPVPVQEETSSSSVASEALRIEIRMNMQVETRVEDAPMYLIRYSLSLVRIRCKKTCVPLCRGNIEGWTVMDDVRRFMNSKARNCACEICNYNVTYEDLRKLARVEHSLVRPSVVDTERLNTWRTLEREMDLGDVISTMQSALFVESVGDGIFEGATNSIFKSEEGSLLTVLFHFRVFFPGMAAGSGSGANASRWISFFQDLEGSLDYLGPEDNLGTKGKQQLFQMKLMTWKMIYFLEMRTMTRRKVYQTLGSRMSKVEFGCLCLIIGGYWKELRDYSTCKSYTESWLIVG